MQNEKRKMKMILGSSGYDVFACSVILFLNHGLRDYLITGLPSIATTLATVANCSAEPELSYNGEKNIVPFFRTNRMDSQDEGCFVLVLNDELGWTDAMVGGVLSSIHWGWFITMATSPLIINRVSSRYMLLASLSLSGLLAMVSHPVAQKGAIGFLFLRLFQGVLQGWSYPIVFQTLESISLSSFIAPYYLLFLAPWLGSSIGVLLGWTHDPFLGSYVFGAISILVGILTSFTLSKSRRNPEKTTTSWRECLTSLPVWACVLLQLGTAWMLHIFLVGLSFTLQFKLGRSDLVWMVFFVIIFGGIVSRFSALIAISLLRIHVLSALNRRRVAILISSAVIIVALITNGVSGIDFEYVLFGLTLLGVGSVAVSLVGIRMNFHDLGPLFPTPFLVLGSAGATVGAGMASLLFPLSAQLHRIDASTPLVQIDDNTWSVAWMAPMVALIAVCCIHVFFLSVIPLPHQIAIGENERPPIAQVNGDVTKDEIDAKSFKSTKSGVSFKTATSRQRTRTGSFKSFDENDIDCRTIADSDDECLSAVPTETDAKDDLKSVVSGVTSFKSAQEDGTHDVKEGEIVINAQGLDRTAAWLTMNQKRGTTKEASVEKKKVERNILIALQW